MIAGDTIHGGCVLVKDAGLLIRGPSGAGKSALAREILFQAGQSGLFARLVSDDRTRIDNRHGRLVARPVQPLEGFMEIRGVGIVRQPFEPSAVIRLVVDLDDQPPRLPEEDEATILLCGVMIPRLWMKSGAVSAHAALGRLSCVCDTVVTL